MHTTYMDLLVKTLTGGLMTQLATAMSLIDSQPEGKCQLTTGSELPIQRHEIAIVRTVDGELILRTAPGADTTENAVYRIRINNTMARVLRIDPVTLTWTLYTVH